MPPDPAHAVKLSCHPETPTDAVRGVAANVSRVREAKLAVSYIIEGDLGRLRVPAPRAPRVEDGLWQHTCCEVFIASKGMPAYYEFNLSPSGEWAAYAFDAYRSRREREPRPEGLAPEIAVRESEGRLELDGVIRIDLLPVLQPRTRLVLALSAVVENSDGVLSYWALRHPPGKPDFHHPQAFALELAG